MSNGTILHPSISSTPRRTFLKAAAAGVSGLLTPFPYLRSSRAQEAEVDNLFVVTFPDGLAGPWQPSGSGSDYVLSETLLPLEPYREQLLIINGLQGGSSNPILAHSEGTVSLWTGSNHYPRLMSYATHPSIDQVVAQAIGGSTAYPSLHAGVQTNRTSFINTPYVHYSGPEAPVPAEDDPNSLYALLAGQLGNDDPGLARRREERRSILDYVQSDLARIRNLVAAEDRPRLEAHEARIRDLERTLDAGGVNAACPELSSVPLTAEAAMANENFELTAETQVDLLVLALQCGLTKVVTLQYSNTDCQLQVERLETHRTVHAAAHDGNATEAERIEWSQFFVEKFAYVLQRLSETEVDQGQTLLDRTLVVIGSEMAYSTHANAPIPLFVAGGHGQYFRKNAYLNIPGGFLEGYDRHTKLLTSIAQAFGLNLDRFGEFTDERSVGALEAARV